MVQKSKFKKPELERFGKEPNIDLTKNPEQAEFFLTSMAAAQHKNSYKILSYGEAIRG